MDPQDAPTSPLPVLALVPIETDFTQVLDASSFENTNDRGGAAIGTYSSRGSYSFGGSSPPMIALFDDCDTCIDCPPECTGEPPPPPPPPAWRWADMPTGMYITRLRIPDDHEGCCFKGDPEFEVHLHAPNQDPTTAEDLRCTGAQAPDPRSKFDMNGTSWSINSSRRPILIADSVQQARFRASYGQNVGMGIVGWEDDDTKGYDGVTGTHTDAMWNVGLGAYVPLGGAFHLRFDLRDYMSRFGADGDTRFQNDVLFSAGLVLSL